jgi:hypothetical protein
MTLYRLRRRRDNTMPPKIFRHIGETSFGRIVRLAFVDSDDEHIFGLVQKRKRIAHGAAALARADGRRRSDAVRPREHVGATLRNPAAESYVRTSIPAEPSWKRPRVRIFCHHDPAELGKRRRQVRPAVVDQFVLARASAALDLGQRKRPEVDLQLCKPLNQPFDLDQ